MIRAGKASLLRSTMVIPAMKVQPTGSCSEQASPPRQVGPEGLADEILLVNRNKSKGWAKA